MTPGVGRGQLGGVGTRRGGNLPHLYSIQVSLFLDSFILYFDIFFQHSEEIWLRIIYQLMRVK